MKSSVYQVGFTNEKTLSIGFTAFLALKRNSRVLKAAAKLQKVVVLAKILEIAFTQKKVEEVSK